MGNDAGIPDICYKHGPIMVRRYDKHPACPHCQTEKLQARLDRALDLISRIHEGTDLQLLYDKEYIMEGK